MSNDRRRIVDTEMLERVVRMEENTRETQKQLENFMREMRRELTSTRTALQEIKDTVSKQRSFVAGIIFAVSTIWAVIAFIVHWLSGGLK